MRFNFGALTSKVPNSVSVKAGRTALKAQKHSPGILFGAGVVGVVATVVMASRATLKLQDILDEAEEKSEKLRVVETKIMEGGATKWSPADIKQAQVSVRLGLAADVIKLYGPAVLIGVCSVAALTGSHVILNKRNAAITAAYAAVEKGFRQYRERVVEEYGAGKDKELMFGVEEREVAVDDENGTTVETIKTYAGASVYAREFNEYCAPFSRAPGANSAFLASQQQWCNDKLKARGHLFLNEVYDMLGMERTKEGSVVGWLYDHKDQGDGYVSFGVFDANLDPDAVDFVNGRVGRILIDPNVDGVIWDKI